MKSNLLNPPTPHENRNVASLLKPQLFPNSSYNYRVLVGYFKESLRGTHNLVSYLAADDADGCPPVGEGGQKRRQGDVPQSSRSFLRSSPPRGKSLSPLCAYSGRSFGQKEHKVAALT